MATKQFWTLEKSSRKQEVDDILSPHLRYPLVNERRQHIFKNKVPMYGIVKDRNGNPVPNSDHEDFMNWLKIRNHVLSKAGKEPLQADEKAVHLFLAEYPRYKYFKAFRHKPRQKVA
jgi:hypothetical protein